MDAPGRWRLSGLFFVWPLTPATVTAPTRPRISALNQTPAVGLLVAVRRSKTNPDGETADVRFVKGDVARALRALRARRGAVEPADRVVGLSA